MESQDYAKKAFQWAKALRLLDPTIKLISCGGKVVFFLMESRQLNGSFSSRDWVL